MSVDDTSGNELSGLARNIVLVVIGALILISSGVLDIVFH